MKRTTLATLGVLLLVLLAWPVVMPAQGKAAVALQQAIETEKVQRDPKKALEMYRKLSTEKDRTIASQALLGMARCYQLQSDAEARRVYERIVNGFKDQPEALAIAQAALNVTIARGNGPQNRRLLALGDVDSTMFVLNDLATVSADGRFLTYVRSQSVNKTLVERDLTTGAVRSLSETGARVSRPAYSRDGKQLVYHWCNVSDRTCELRLISVAERGTTRHRVITGGLTHPGTVTWMPDGKSIVLNERSRDDRSRDDFDIVLIDITSGEKQLLKQKAGPSVRMSVSPNGRYLAWDRLDGPDTADIAVMRLDERQESIVVDHPAQDLLVGWSPDGNDLLFTSKRGTGTTDVYAQALVDGRRQGTARLLYADLGRRDFSVFGVTNTGALFYGQGEGPGEYSEVQVVSIDFNSGTIGTPTTIGGERTGWTNDSPAWSPDGRQLAFTSRPIDVFVAGTVVVIRDIASRTSRVLRPPLRGFTGLKWSPDGRSFVCQGVGSDGVFGIYRINAQTEEVGLVVRDGVRPMWSRDGASIFYQRGDVQKGMAFIAHDLATGKETELIRRPVLGIPTLSPDGRYLLTFVNDAAADTRTILAVPTSGGEPRVLRVNKPATGGSRLWTPDSQAVIASDGSRLWRVTLDGRESPFAQQTIGGDELTMDPNGPRLAYVRRVTAQYGTEPSLWVLENFLAQDKATNSRNQAASR